MSFVFHVDGGRVIGASIYPVRDQFQFGRTGSVMALHGPVKWFDKHSFDSLGTTHQQGNGGSGEGMGPVGIIIACVFCVLITITMTVLFYLLRLKPMLIKKYTKGD